MFQVFRTSSSGKPRTICLGFMLHSSKEKTNHTSFAEFLKKKVAQLSSLKRQCPVIVVDGEASLIVYGEVCGFSFYFIIPLTVSKFFSQK